MAAKVYLMEGATMCEECITVVIIFIEDLSIQFMAWD